MITRTPTLILLAFLLSSCTRESGEPGNELRILNAGGGDVLVEGTSCGTICELVVQADAIAAPEAMPAAGSTFRAWFGDCQGSGRCEVNMLGRRTVYAEFGPVYPRWAIDAAPDRLAAAAGVMAGDAEGFVSVYLADGVAPHLAAFDPDGRALWGLQIQHDRGAPTFSALDVQPEGLVAAGRYSGRWTVSGTELPAASDGECFLARFDRDGAPLGAEQLPCGPMGSVTAVHAGAGVDYVLGEFTGDGPPGIGPSLGGTDVFLTSAGGASAPLRLGSTGDDRAIAMGVSDSQPDVRWVWLSLGAAGTLGTEAVPAGLHLVAVGALSVDVVASMPGVISNEVRGGLAFTADGEPLVAASFVGTLDGHLTNDDGDMVFARIGIDGTVRWLRVVAAARPQVVSSVARWGDEFVLAGGYDGHVVFGPAVELVGPRSLVSLPENGFIAGLSQATGEPSWARTVHTSINAPARVAPLGDEIVISSTHSGWSMLRYLLPPRSFSAQTIFARYSRDP